MTDAPKPTLTEAESEGLIAAIQDGTEDAYVARIKAAARREALLAFADTRGVNVGDEHGEWWQGYRQAQRECLHDATKAALAEPTCAVCGHPNHGSFRCTSTVDYDQRNDSYECTCPGALAEPEQVRG
jgi:hypothetical protein